MKKVLMAAGILFTIISCNNGSDSSHPNADSTTIQNPVPGTVDSSLNRSGSPAGSDTMRRTDSGTRR